MSLPESTSFVEFEQPGPHETVGRCRIHYGIPVRPENFEDYQADARNLIAVLKGEREGDLDKIAEAGLNAIGLDTFLAALAYEILT